MLTEKTYVDQIEVLESGIVQVRQVIRIYRDEQALSSSYHRHTLRPGDDLSKEEPRTAAIAQAAWNHLS